MSGAELRPISGHPGYHVSADGRVLSDWTQRPLPRRGGTEAVIDSRRRHELKGHPVRNGYLAVDLRGVTFTIHRLVLEAWTGPRPSGMEARHLDGNRTNNAASNLVWGSPIENARDRLRHGNTVMGARHSQAKLTETVVSDLLRREQLSRLNRTKEAKALGVSRAAICRVLSRKNWRYLEVPHGAQSDC